MKFFKFFTLWSILFISFGVVSCQTTSPNHQFHTTLITRVYDGDTFYDERNSYRLFGIDAAELKDKQGNKTNKLINYYAELAAQFTKSLILDKHITLHILKNDRYKRKVVRAQINDQDLATLLIKNGLAIMAYFSLESKNIYYYNDVNYYYELLQSQNNAQKNKLGFWREPISKVHQIFANHFNKNTRKNGKMNY